MLREEFVGNFGWKVLGFLREGHRFAPLLRLTRRQVTIWAKNQTFSSGPKMSNNQKNDGSLVTRRAAMYVRMSTDHQKYSTENQADAIREYAARYQIEIIETYTDSGKSGLSLDGRDALKTTDRRCTNRRRKV